MPGMNEKLRKPPEHRVAGSWIAVLILLFFVLVLYPLSIGPARWMEQRGWIYYEVTETVYKPLVWLYYRSPEDVQRAVLWYEHLWMEDPLHNY